VRAEAAGGQQGRQARGYARRDGACSGPATALAAAAAVLASAIRAGVVWRDSGIRCCGGDGADNAGARANGWNCESGPQGRSSVVAGSAAAILNRRSRLSLSRSSAAAPDSGAARVTLRRCDGGMQREREGVAAGEGRREGLGDRQSSTQLQQRGEVEGGGRRVAALQLQALQRRGCEAARRQQAQQAAQQPPPLRARLLQAADQGLERGSGGVVGGQQGLLQWRCLASTGCCTAVGSSTSSSSGSVPVLRCERCLHHLQRLLRSPHVRGGLSEHTREQAGSPLLHARMCRPQGHSPHVGHAHKQLPCRRTGQQRTGKGGRQLVLLLLLLGL
jgi:hypothetical protein